LGTIAISFGSIYYSLRAADRAEAALEHEYERSEDLLHNLMPTSIAIRLKDKPDSIIADQFDAVTILFADIVDFTPRSTRLTPAELVTFLNGVFFRVRSFGRET
jgi:adenylate cyclase